MNPSRDRERKKGRSKQRDQLMHRWGSKVFTDSLLQQIPIACACVGPGTVLSRWLWLDGKGRSWSGEQGSDRPGGGGSEPVSYGEVLRGFCLLGRNRRALGLA